MRLIIYITWSIFGMTFVILLPRLMKEGYVPMMLPIDLSPYPVILDYIKRITQRPAFQNTIGKR